MNVMALGAVATPIPTPDTSKTIGVTFGDGKVSFEQGAVIAFLVGLVLLLMKVVDYFIRRREKNQANEPTTGQHSPEDISKLDVILDRVNESFDLKNKVLENVQEIRSLISQSINNCQLCGNRIEKILSATERMLDMHAKTDEYGIPVWYMPRAWFENQKEVLGAMAKVAETQRDTLLVLEKISQRIEKLENQ
jgi:hypothetical protein